MLCSQQGDKVGWDIWRLFCPDSIDNRVNNIPLYEFMGQRGCVGSLSSKRGWGGKRRNGQVQGEQRQEVSRKALWGFSRTPSCSAKELQKQKNCSSCQNNGHSKHSQAHSLSLLLPLHLSMWCSEYMLVRACVVVHSLTAYLEHECLFWYDDIVKSVFCTGYGYMIVYFSSVCKWNLKTLV